MVAGGARKVIFGCLAWYLAVLGLLLLLSAFAPRQAAEERNSPGGPNPVTVAPPEGSSHHE
ncbi:hypothetical protein [Aquisphaera insulae]|uniref:hypothetical protein n=1 Tax=Aquisphaera insulae TaxID=2712864 RepID=UPI0013EAAB21|nr:hypothetical protein [Aquisphaera insulae]